MMRFDKSLFVPHHKSEGQNHISLTSAEDFGSYNFSVDKDQSLSTISKRIRWQIVFLTMRCLLTAETIARSSSPEDLCCDVTGAHSLEILQNLRFVIRVCLSHISELVTYDFRLFAPLEAVSRKLRFPDDHQMEQQNTWPASC